MSFFDIFLKEKISAFEYGKLLFDNYTQSLPRLLQAFTYISSDYKNEVDLKEMGFSDATYNKFNLSFLVSAFEITFYQLRDDPYINTINDGVIYSEKIYLEHFNLDFNCRELSNKVKSIISNNKMLNIEGFLFPLGNIEHADGIYFQLAENLFLSELVENKNRAFIDLWASNKTVCILHAIDAISFCNTIGRNMYKNFKIIQ